MKIKDVTLELANAICEIQMKKHDCNEHTCKDCPLKFDNENFCGKSFAFYNDKYGNKKINFKECD